MGVGRWFAESEGVMLCKMRACNLYPGCNLEWGYRINPLFSWSYGLFLALVPLYPRNLNTCGKYVLRVIVK